MMLRRVLQPRSLSLSLKSVRIPTTVTIIEPTLCRSFTASRSLLAAVNDDSHNDFKPKRANSNDALKQKFEEIKKVIDDEVKKEPVVLFMKGTPNRPECGFSRTVIQVLENYNIKYKTFNMNEDVLMKEALKEYSDWPTIPQLYVKGEFQGGCDIVVGLHRDHKLGDILKDSGAESTN
jgi:monothiol glutaredoxin